MMTLKIALRNIFRHKARTTITLSTIVFGCVALIFIGGFFEDIFVVEISPVGHFQHPFCDADIRAVGCCCLAVGGQTAKQEQTYQGKEKYFFHGKCIIVGETGRKVVHFTAEIPRFRYCHPFFS